MVLAEFPAFGFFCVTRALLSVGNQLNSLMLQLSKSVFHSANLTGRPVLCFLFGSITLLSLLTLFQLVLFLSQRRLSLLYLRPSLFFSLLDTRKMLEPLQFASERTDESPRSLDIFPTDRTQAFQDD